MRLYHTTDAADVILHGGFRDATGSYGLVDFTLSGVFLADIPVGPNEGAKGEQVLEIALPDDVVLHEYELIYEDPTMQGFREWCVPADVINSRGTVRLLSEDEVDALGG